MSISGVLEERRACRACGGIVDVMTIETPPAHGRAIPTKIGACLRCGQWFNEAGLLELRRLSASPPNDPD